MNNAAIQSYLFGLFAQHDVELDSDEDWLMTDGDFPAIRASWHEGSHDEGGRLDVDVVLSEERCIESAFAGSGAGEIGCREALDRFAKNDFHLLLAACWYVTDDRKMRITAWEIGVRTWDVFIGPFTLRGLDENAVVIPPDALTAIEAALKREALTPELHWLRLVHLHAANGERRCEASLDNEPWTAGTLALDSVAWPANERQYSARCFIMLDVRDY